MGTIQIKVCDLCGDEERSDHGKYWVNVFSGPIAIDFKSAPGVQQNRKYDVLCHSCSRQLWKSIDEAILSLKKSIVAKTVLYGDRK